jgi:hypothetical protein
LSPTAEKNRRLGTLKLKLDMKLVERLKFDPLS